MGGARLGATLRLPPALLETYVERDRFRGTCYKAANWVHIGHTRGRGKLDRYKRRDKPVKEIFLWLSRLR